MCVFPEFSRSNVANKQVWEDYLDKRAPSSWPGHQDDSDVCREDF